jgi:hypothetical protein
MKDYYAAYVIDPLGNNVEVVYFGWLLLRIFNSVSYILPAVVGAGIAMGATMLLK